MKGDFIYSILEVARWQYIIVACANEVMHIENMNITELMKMKVFILRDKLNECNMVGSRLNFIKLLVDRR